VTLILPNNYIYTIIWDSIEIFLVVQEMMHVYWWT